MGFGALFDLEQFYYLIERILIKVSNFYGQL